MKVGHLNSLCNHRMLTYRYLTETIQTHQRNKMTLSLSSESAVDHEMVERIKRQEIQGLPIVHHHGYVCSLPIKHRFAMRKFHGVMRYLKTDHVISSKQVIEPELIDPESLMTVHTQDYIDRFIEGKTTREEQRITGFEWSEGLVSRCRYETGGTLLAARLAIDRGVACSTGGGTHHAFPSYGSGYCLVNDLAVTASVLLEEGTVQKVLILDLDVHQGDGTANIFQHRDDVFTFSMHCEKNFPQKKQLSDVDIGLENKTEDMEYLKILTSHLPWILDSFRPDLVLYDAGVDPHYKDELGKLHLSDQGLFDRDRYVIKECISHGIPVATVIGGGYQRDLDALSIRHTIVHRAASKVWEEKNITG